MWFRPINESFHPFNYILRHTLESGVLKPVLSSVSNEGMSLVTTTCDGCGRLSMSAFHGNRSGGLCILLYCTVVLERTYTILVVVAGPLSS